MLGAGQRHVEQAQVFTEALLLGLCQAGLVRFEQQPAAFAVVHLHRFLVVQRAEGTDEGQEHQRVFQALGFVDGHHAHQGIVAFQAQHLLLGSLTAPGQGFAKVADQRQLTVQFSGSELQQLGQVQQVGQHPFAVRAAHQPLRQAEILQQLTQHRQHALALPALTIATELHDPRLPEALVEVQSLQLGQAQAQGRAGQRRAQRAVLIRFGAGAQPQQQVMGFHGVEH